VVVGNAGEDSEALWCLMKVFWFIRAHDAQSKNTRVPETINLFKCSLALSTSVLSEKEFTTPCETLRCGRRHDRRRSRHRD
jgi:hypothetical protein